MSRRDAVGRARRLMPGAHEQLAKPSARLTAANAEARKPMNGEAELADGEEAARVVEQAPHAPRAGPALVHELLDAAAPDRHQGDLGGDEERLERGRSGG